MNKVQDITELLQLGIKAESLRQQAIANNIANLQTPGYRRVEVKFEQLLAKAMQSGKEVKLSKVEPQFYQPMDTPVKSNGNDVEFEKEIGELVKNSLRHKTYVRVLNNKYKQIELAINTK